LANPTAEEKEVFYDIFHRHLLHYINRDRDEWQQFIDDHVAEEIVGVHAHHTSHPFSPRIKQGQQRVLTVEDYFASYFANSQQLAKAYHSLVWADVNHQHMSDGPDYKCAVVGIVYEGYTVFNKSASERVREGFGIAATQDGFIDNPYVPHYHHLSVYILRQAEPFDSEKWKIVSAIGVLPAGGYPAKLDPQALAGLEKIEDLRVQQLGDIPSLDNYDIAFFDETSTPGANPDFYYGWEVVVNRSR